MIAAGSLTAAADWLRGTPGLHDGVTAAAEFDRVAAARRRAAPDAGGGPDLADVLGQVTARIALEIGRDCLDALRQPLEAGEIVLARSGVTARFPARFTLVLAANPCPCAKVAGPAEGCSCSAMTRRRYLGRISGPLLDRVDVKIELLPVGRKELLNDTGFAEPSALVAKRVAAARDRTRQRLAGTPWRLNAEVPGAELRRTWAPARGALAMVEKHSNAARSAPAASPKSSASPGPSPTSTAATAPAKTNATKHSHSGSAPPCDHPLYEQPSTRKELSSPCTLCMTTTLPQARTSPPPTLCSPHRRPSRACQ